MALSLQGATGQKTWARYAESLIEWSAARTERAPASDELNETFPLRHNLSLSALVVAPFLDVLGRY